VLVKGDLNSRQLDVKMPSIRAQINNLAGHYRLPMAMLSCRICTQICWEGISQPRDDEQVTGDSHSRIECCAAYVISGGLKRFMGKAAATPMFLLVDSECRSERFVGQDI